MVRPGKGILAADESGPTITKRFGALGIESTEETRRRYRTLLFTAPGVAEFLSGIILFEETLGQRDNDGTPLPEVLTRQGILVGIKVDKGTTPLPNAHGDLITQGLDGLAERLKTYKAQGARFAKWREVYAITDRNPTALGIKANAEVLARYAAICQQEGIVPIVEPEVLIDGDHTIERCHEVSESVLHAVFDALHEHRVLLEGMVLKPSMVLPGNKNGATATSRANCEGDAGSASPNSAGGSPDHQFPVGRTKPGKRHRESQRDERDVPACSVGAVVLVRAGAAGPGDAHMGRTRSPMCRPHRRHSIGASR